MTRVRGAGAALMIVVLAAVSACSTTSSSGSVLGALADTARPAATGSGGPAALADASTVTAPSTTTSSSTPPPPPPAEVSASPANGTEGVDPLAPVSVAVAKGTLESVRLTNPEGVEVPGTLAADRLSWTAQTELGYAKTYILTTSARSSSSGVINETTSTFTTVVPTNKTKAYPFPSDGMTVGVAQPISIHFDEPVRRSRGGPAGDHRDHHPGADRWVPVDRRPGGAVAAGGVLAARHHGRGDRRHLRQEPG